jgi:copper(I)-binding protein
MMLISKKMKLFNAVMAMFFSLFFFMNVHAQEAKIGNLKIEGAYTRSTVPGQKSAAGFMKVIGQGNSDQLIGASSLTSEEVQLHSMTMEGDVMRMRQVNGIDIPANGDVELKPGGLHLMFVGIKSPLTVGTDIKVKLKFAKAGEVEVNFPVTVPSGHHSSSHDHSKMK